MKHVVVIGSLAAGSFLTGGSTFAENQAKEAAEKAEIRVYQLVDKDMTTIKFAPGSTTLTDAEKLRLRALADNVKGDNTIDRVIVAAWSDKEYPATRDTKLDKQDRDLADKRKDDIKKVLKDDGVSTVDAFSMAEHPAWILRVFNTEQAKIKGEGKIRDADDRVVADLGRQIRAKGGPDEAVIIVKHKENAATAH